MRKLRCSEFSPNALSSLRVGEGDMEGISISGAEKINPGKLLDSRGNQLSEVPVSSLRIPFRTDDTSPLESDRGPVVLDGNV